ncbi:MAG: prolyl oligopeptidase family serine peptidase [Candidatus Schekmanbacteria bacterium]|nr:prolyl oligopeptidase family serine peptidase [Candidatus Schekmanbacteria bacterium]
MVADRRSRWCGAVVFALVTVLGVTTTSAAHDAFAKRALLLSSPRMPEGIAVEILAPADWDRRTRAVLMLFLSDRVGSASAFRRHGLAEVLAATLRRDGMPPVVVVSPGHAGTFLLDSQRGLMESFIIRDLIPTVERLYPGAGGDRDHRVAWGISMGGWGALRFAFRHPHTFSRAAAMAPWIVHLTWEQHAERRSFLSKLLVEPSLGGSVDESRFEHHDIYHLAAAAASGGLVPELFLAIGEKDRFRSGAEEYARFLRDQGFQPEVLSMTGAHHAWYSWRKFAATVFAWLLKPPRAGLATAPRLQ